MPFTRLLPIVPALTLALAVAGCSEDAVTADPTGTGTGGSGGSGGSGGGGGGGVGGAGDGVGGAGGEGGQFIPGDPITAPSEAWTWIPFDDAFCANGSTTGIGVNLTDQSKNVVVFMMGGGACWNYLTCYQLNTASNLDGYGEGEFQQDSQGLLATSLFDRNDPNNPVKDYSYVFVPYCTGDVHAGTKVTDYNGTATSHVGYNNMTAYLKRVVPTFPDADRLLLSGSSAGGFGVGINWWRVQQVFPQTRVDLLDDSGPALGVDYLSPALQTSWRDAWGLDASLPPDCAECATALDGIFSYYGTKMTNQRGALLSHTKDNVISAFMQITTAKFEEGLNKLTADRLEGQPNFRYYYFDGTGHVLLGDPGGFSQNGVVLTDWLRQMVDDDPAWQSVKP